MWSSAHTSSCLRLLLLSLYRRTGLTVYCIASVCTCVHNIPRALWSLPNVYFAALPSNGRRYNRPSVVTLTITSLYYDIYKHVSWTRQSQKWKAFYRIQAHGIVRRRLITGWDGVGTSAIPHAGRQTDWLASSEWITSDRLIYLSVTFCLLIVRYKLERERKEKAST